MTILANTVQQYIYGESSDKDMTLILLLSCLYSCSDIVEAALGSLLAYTLCSTSWWNHARITGICYWCSKSSQSGNVYFVSNNHQDIIHAHCCISCIIYRAYCSLLLSDSFEHFYFRLTAISRQICVYNSKVHGPTDSGAANQNITNLCCSPL